MTFLLILHTAGLASLCWLAKHDSIPAPEGPAHAREADHRPRNQ